MTAADLILPCRDCGKPIAIAKIGGVLAYGHLVNPTFMHHEAKPPRMRIASPASRSADDVSRMGCVGSRPLNRVREDVPAQRTNGKRAASDGTGPDRNSRSGRRPSGTTLELRAEPLQSGHPSSLTPAPLGAPRRSAARSG